MTRALALVLVAGVALAARPPELPDGELTRRTEALGQQAAQRRAQLKRRLRALYKLSNGGALRLLFGATSADELDRRRATLERVVARDLAELASLRHEARDLGAEEQRRQLALARALDAEAAANLGLGQRKGALVWPVNGAVVGAFGAYRDAALGIERSRRGVELGSRPGELVRATAAGKVRFIGDVPGLGRGLALDHGDGYLTLYAHLGLIHCAVGDRVRESDLVADAAGDTLYFELTQAATAVDPIPWLAPR
jgi:septal ring factor EnvC (AmiA/AmiB activator)